VTGAAGTNPKGTTMSYFRTVAGTIVLAVIVAMALSATAAGATTPGATDGTETYQFAAPFDTPTGFGPPPEAPHLETLNGEAVVCVDPPNSQLGYVNLTIHTDQNADVLVYAHDEAHHTQQFHTIESGLIDACEPWTPPAAVCPEDGTDQVVTVWATWNIGSGRSALLELPTDCPDPVVPPVVPPGPPVELAPPVVTVATPVATPVTELAVTGVDDTVALIAFGLSAIAIGWSMTRNARIARNERFGR